ncbi:MobP3 family relaxase [Paenibacillus elgii]|uniref:MobP3 family relaxase n=1 Tax=Paenibacillus elgii TaxID=189691 RepID=UPI0013D59032|nr:MobP3 family relaxase [Paenibacillus elgii]
MSILIYKQRFFHPNHPKTAKSNYCHIGYIATRPGAVKNEGMNHGLFGKLRPGDLQEFSSWQEVARLARDLSRKKKNMYRSVISFKRDTALELGLTNQKAWQQYIEQHISTIAAQNHIKGKNLCWVAAVHNEKEHPHLHVVFWDRQQDILKNYTHPEIPNHIRRQLIKDTFAYKIKQFCALRDQFKSGITEITDRMVSEFELYIKNLNPKSFKVFYKRFMNEDEDSLHRLPKHHLFQQSHAAALAEKLVQLRANMPKTGRLAYQLLPPAVKSMLDELVQELMKTNPYLAQMVEDYVQVKVQIAMLYDTDPERIANYREKYLTEAKKRIANRILGTVRTLIKMEREVSMEQNHRIRRQYLAEQLLVGILDMLESLIMNGNIDYDDKAKAMGTELSKQAKKEWFLKHRDKGVER